MKITKRQLRRIIKEEAADILDIDHPSEAEAIEDVWSGDLEGEAKNLALDIDHPVAAGSEETTKEPEMLPRHEDLVAETAFRRIVRKALRNQSAVGVKKESRTRTTRRRLRQIIEEALLAEEIPVK